MSKSVSYRNKYINLTRIRLFRSILKLPLAGISVHWIFQGMVYMDRTERLFKLAFDLVLTGWVGMLLRRWWPAEAAFVAGFFVAHTINFLLNAQLWVVLKHYGYINNSRERFDQYTRHLNARIQKQRTIAVTAVIGSEVRNGWQPASDLDVRLVRHPGFLNGLKASVFVLSERTRATFSRFPLDIYLLDSHSRLDHHPDESPRIFKAEDEVMNGE